MIIIALWSKLFWRSMWCSYDVIKPLNKYIVEYSLLIPLVQKYKKYKKSTKKCRSYNQKHEWVFFFLNTVYLGILTQITSVREGPCVASPVKTGIIYAYNVYKLISHKTRKSATNQARILRPVSQILPHTISSCGRNQRFRLFYVEIPTEQHGGYRIRYVSTR